MYQCLLIVCVILCQLYPSIAEQCVPSVSPPDPNSGCCGLADGSSLKKNTSMADINEYPWTALVEWKKKDNSIKLLCSAILISGRYALSVASCFSKLTVKIGTPYAIRFGEYETNNEGKDCVEVKPAEEICNDGAISVPIEKMTRHPRYNLEKKQNDIVLVKLAETVPYTDFIRPICLPSLDITLHAPKNFFMTVAGWGAVNSASNKSNVLRRVHVPFVENQICHSKYEAKYNFSLIDSHLCAGSKNRDACRGDSGGPLMYFYRNKTELGGIVSFGPTLCGLDIPGVYTKVFAFKDWIYSVIEEDLTTISTTSTTTDSGVIYFRDKK